MRDFVNSDNTKTYRNSNGAMAEVFHTRDERGFDGFQVNYSASKNALMETSKFYYSEQGSPWTNYKSKEEAAEAAAKYIRRRLK